MSRFFMVQCVYQGMSINSSGRYILDDCDHCQPMKMHVHAHLGNLGQH